MSATPKPVQEEAPAVKVPAHIRHFVDVLGIDGAVDFLLAFGGGYAYFSLDPDPKTDIASQIGVEATAAITQRFGPGSMRVPTAKPFIARVLSGKGKRPSEIARTLHVSDVAVRGWLQDDESRQLKLF